MYVTESDPVSAMIHPRDVAAVAAHVLTTPGHDGRAYTLTGGRALSPAATQAEFDRLGWSGPRLEALLELKRQSAAWDRKIFDTVERLTGEPPLTLHDWVRENIHLFQ
ncbi:hypothetical protein ABZ907_37985 [Nonomuraea wenchangensis]